MSATITAVMKKIKSSPALILLVKLLIVLAGAIAAVIALSRTPVIKNNIQNLSAFSLLITCLFFLAACAFLFNKKYDNFLTFAFILAAAACLIIARSALFYYASGDYNSFLKGWIEQLKAAPGFSGLSKNIGNYNMPYLYILFMISRIPYSGLFLIKAVSVAFDILLAYFAMKLVSLKTENLYMHILAFLGTFAIPTVILNSAMWAQCDSIYVSLILGSLYFALKQKSIPCFALLGLAFSFKLQAIFIFPVILFLLLQKKIKLSAVWAAFASFLLTLMPAVLAGKPFKDTISIYFKQTTYYSDLVKNAPSIYNLLGNISQLHFIAFAFYIAGAAALCLLFFAFKNKDKITAPKQYIELSYLFALMLPFLLPKMHDRYFYLADALSLLVFLYNKKKWYIPLVTIFCSYICYTRFIMYEDYNVFPPKYLSLGLLIILILSLKDFILPLIEKKPAETSVPESGNNKVE